MSNSKNKKTGSKSTSFNKSKSKSISDAMRDLEVDGLISKEGSDFETKDDDILNESVSDDDLEVDGLDESVSDDDLEMDDYSIDFDIESEDSILTESNMEGVNLEDLEKDSSSSDVIVEDASERDIEDLLDDIFVSPEEGVIESSLDDEVVLDKPKFKSNKLNLSKHSSESKSKPVDLSRRFTKSKSNSNSKSKSKDFKNLFGTIKSRVNVKSIRGVFSSRSKILALLGIIVGIIIIIYGIMSFSNVSDRVVDHVLLGEAGSWSIFIILFGLIIILLDIFFVFYYKQYLKNSSVNNVTLRHTFDTIDKIKSIDSDYYEEDDFDNVSLKDLFKGKQEKESPNNIKNSIFDNETINSDSITVDTDDSEFITVEAVDDNDLNDSSAHVDSFDDE